MREISFCSTGLWVRSASAYNWRDTYFTGGVTQPGYQEEYEQWDASIQYELTDGLTIFAEGSTLPMKRGEPTGRPAAHGVGQIGARFNRLRYIC